MKNFEIGDKVQLTAKTHSWHVEHINEVFLRPGVNQFEKQYFEEIALLLGSKARRTKLKGIVTGFGATDENGKPFLNVCFQWKDLCAEFYCEQKDIKKL